MSKRQKGSDHYKQGFIEPIDYIIANEMGWHEGNVIKYVTRHPHSGTGQRDLEKAIHYLEMALYHYYGAEVEHGQHDSSAKEESELDSSCSDCRGSCSDRHRYNG